MIGDRPAHHPAAPGVEHDGQVRLAVSSRVFGDVHDPQAIRCHGIEGPIDQVVGGLWRRGLDGCSPALAAMDARDAGLTHETLDPLAGAAGVLSEAQLGVDPGRSIGAPAHRSDVDDGVGRAGVVVVPVAHRVLLPGIEARGGHLHHPTAGRHGQVRAGPGDEGVRHFGRTYPWQSRPPPAGGSPPPSSSCAAPGAGAPARPARRWTGRLAGRRRCRPASPSCASRTPRSRGPRRSWPWVCPRAGPARWHAAGTPGDGVWACGHPSKRRLSPPHVGCPPERGKLITRAFESCSGHWCDEPGAQARRSGSRTARNPLPSPTIAGIPLFPITRVPFESYGVIVFWDRVHSMRR